MTNLALVWLQRDEGWRAQPYRDSKGILTVGFGHNLESAPLPGVSFPLSEEEGELILKEDMARHWKELVGAKPFIQDIDPPRSAALLNMAFMGVGKLLKFVNLWAAAERGDWFGASDEVWDSKWRRDVGMRRAGPVAYALKHGEWPPEVLSWSNGVRD